MKDRSIILSVAPPQYVHINNLKKQHEKRRNSFLREKPPNLLIPINHP